MFQEHKSFSHWLFSLLHRLRSRCHQEWSGTKYPYPAFKSVQIICDLTHCHGLLKFNTWIWVLFASIYGLLLMLTNVYWDEAPMLFVFGFKNALSLLCTLCTILWQGRHKGQVWCFTVVFLKWFTIYFMLKFKLNWLSYCLYIEGYHISCIINETIHLFYTMNKSIIPAFNHWSIIHLEYLDISFANTPFYVRWFN